VFETTGLGTASHGIYYENVLAMKSKADKVAYMKRMQHYKFSTASPHFFKLDYISKK
jgi:hypothetical protein